MASVLDAFVKFLADTADIDKALATIPKQADAAGAKSGESFNAGMGRVVKANLGKLLAAGFTAGLAIAAKGILELEKIENDFQATTGATAQEAKEAGKAILDMSTRNLQPLEEIGRALAKVHTDMGLTGDEAVKLTEQMLKFAHVTHQDAAAAVELFDKILDAWNLSASDAVGIMDKLVVSSQKFGGSILQNEQVIADLGPAFTAAGLSIDDAIALLNLFQDKGVEAAGIPLAFQTALSKVHSPEELKRLIADIGATPDAFTRGAKAADLFGARAGQRMGAALAGANLDDYRVNAEEAADATNHMAEVMDQGFGAQLQLKIKQVGAALIGLGDTFSGTATTMATTILVLTQLGGATFIGKFLGPFKKLGARLVAVIVAAIMEAVVPAAVAGEIVGDAAGGAIVKGSRSKLARLLTGLESVLGPPAGKLGTFMGTSLGKAMSVAFAAIAIFEAIKTWNDVREAIAAQAAALNTQTQEFASKASLDQLQKARKGLQEQKDDLLNNVLIKSAAMLGLGDAGIAIDSQLALLDAKLRTALDEEQRRSEHLGEHIGEATAKGIGAGFTAHTSVVATEVDSFVNNSIRGRAADAARKLTVDFRRTGAEAALALGQGLQAKRQAVEDAFDSLVEMLKHPTNRFKQEAHLVGLLTSKELARGLKSSDGVIRKQAEGTVGLIIARLQELAAGGGKLGEKAQLELEKGLRSKNPLIKKAAEDARDAIKNGVKPDGQEQTGITVIDQLTSGLGNSAARARLAKSASQLRQIVQDALNGLGTAGLVHGGTTNSNAGRNDERHYAIGGRVTANTPVWVGENGRERFTPGVDGRIETEAQRQASGEGAGGTQVTIITPAIPIDNRRPISDVASGLVQLARTGNLTKEKPQRVLISRSG